MIQGSAATVGALVLVLESAQYGYKEYAIYDGCGVNFSRKYSRETS